MSDADTKTPPESIEAQRVYLQSLKDEDIDCSDIPPIRSFSDFIRIDRYVDVSDYPTRRAAYDAAVAIRHARRKAAE